MISRIRSTSPPRRRAGCRRCPPDCLEQPRRRCDAGHHPGRTLLLPDKGRFLSFGRKRTEFIELPGLATSTAVRYTSCSASAMTHERYQRHQPREGPRRNAVQERWSAARPGRPPKPAGQPLFQGSGGRTLLGGSTDQRRRASLGRDDGCLVSDRKDPGRRPDRAHDEHGRRPPPSDPETVPATYQDRAGT
jgi:hypothetical protein